jgi:hypothetical protein
MLMMAFFGSMSGVSSGGTGFSKEDHHHRPAEDNEAAAGNHDPNCNTLGYENRKSRQGCWKQGVPSTMMIPDYQIEEE